MEEFDKNLTLFAQTNFRNAERKFGIKLDDRRRHFYVIGKTGMGKTTLLENMVLSDIYAGHGIAVVDPHGDFAENILDYIPDDRIDDVVYFNPADVENPIGFNILETVNESHKHLIAAGLMGVFKKIWVDQWSARMEYILNNTILALMDNEGSTLLGINRMYSDKKFRKRMVENIKDPVVKSFWVDEYANWDQRYEREATAAIQNKIGQFLAVQMIRNIVAQPKSSMNMRKLMDEGKILIVNLSKGRIGEDNSRLLGGMLVTKIQLSAMERVDIPQEERRDFFLYVDEFQNFATESFANILSEARKYRLGLIMAHQYIEQLDETVAAAVFGNVGTIVAFRVGATDAEVLEKEYEPDFTMNDLINLPKYQIYLRLMINGVASVPFSAMTLSPIARNTHNTKQVIEVSRKRYGRDRAEIQQQVAEWSGVMVDEHGNLIKAEPKVEVKKSDPKKSSYSSSSSSKPSYKKTTSGSSVATSSSSRNASRKFEPRKNDSRRESTSTSKRPERKEETKETAPSVVDKQKKEEKVDSSASNRGSGNDHSDRDRKRRGRRGGSDRNKNRGSDKRNNTEKKDVRDVLVGDPKQKGMSLDQLKDKK